VPEAMPLIAFVTGTGTGNPEDSRADLVDSA